MKKLSMLMVMSLFTTSSALAQDGSSCAAAIPIRGGGDTFSTDTTMGTNWIGNYGPLVSQSNDIVYTFTTGATAPINNLVVNSATYSFALYLLSGCAANSDPSPIGATATIGGTINLSGVTAANTQYWVAVTGTAAGGATANGTLNWSISPPFPVMLQSFEVE